MKSTKRDNFSPFQKVRRLTIYLRLCFGFPLSRIENTIDQYKFDNVIESLRYILFNIGSGLNGIYTVYFQYQATKIANPILSMKEVFRGIGFSGMDIGALLIISVINHFSNFIYFVLFKRSVVGLNKALRYLTKINEELHTFLNDKNIMCRRNEISCFYLYLHLLTLEILAFLTSGMLSYSWTKLFFRKYSSLFTTGEKATFSVSMFFSCLFYTYPPMTKSSDFVVCYILEETKNVFGCFKMAMASTTKLHNENESASWLNCPSLRLHNTKNRMRYVK